jgi:hypothetical protein
LFCGGPWILVFSDTPQVTLMSIQGESVKNKVLVSATRDFYSVRLVLGLGIILLKFPK